MSGQEDLDVAAVDDGWRWKAYLVAGVLVVLFLAGFAALSIQRVADPALDPWPTDPLVVRDPKPVLLSAETPITITSMPGDQAIERVDLFTELSGAGVVPDVVVREIDDSTDRVMARVVVPGSAVVDRGITSVVIPVHQAEAEVSLELATSSPNADEPSQTIVLQGLTSAIPGLQFRGKGMGDGVVAVSARLMGQAWDPLTRARLMYDRTLDRWPTWNRAVFPVALLIATVTTAMISAMLVASILGRERLLKSVASAAIVAVMVAPVLMHVLRHR